MSLATECIRHLGKRDLGDGIGFVRDQSRDQTVRISGDILPMEEALSHFAVLGIGPRLSDSQQPRQPRPAGAILRPDQQ